MHCVGCRWWWERIMCEIKKKISICFRSKSVENSYNYSTNQWVYRSISLTDHEIDNTAEDNRGNSAQGDVRQDLREEVDGHSVVATDVLVPDTRKHKQKSNTGFHNVKVSKCLRARWVLHDFLTDHIHKQFPLDDEELGCRHSAETLVGGDEEEGSHPVRTKEQNSVFKSFLVGKQCHLLMQGFIPVIWNVALSVHTQI